MRGRPVSSRVLGVHGGSPCRTPQRRRPLPSLAPGVSVFDDIGTARAGMSLIVDIAALRPEWQSSSTFLVSLSDLIDGRPPRHRSDPRTRQPCGQRPAWNARPDPPGGSTDGAAVVAPLVHPWGGSTDGAAAPAPLVHPPGGSNDGSVDRRGPSSAGSVVGRVNGRSSGPSSAGSPAGRVIGRRRPTGRRRPLGPWPRESSGLAQLRRSSTVLSVWSASR